MSFLHINKCRQKVNKPYLYRIEHIDLRLSSVWLQNIQRQNIVMKSLIAFSKYCASMHSTGQLWHRAVALQGHVRHRAETRSGDDDAAVGSDVSAAHRGGAPWCAGRAGRAWTRRSVFPGAAVDQQHIHLPGVRPPGGGSHGVSVSDVRATSSRRATQGPRPPERPGGAHAEESPLQRGSNLGGGQCHCWHSWRGPVSHRTSQPDLRGSGGRLLYALSIITQYTHFYMPLL